MFLKWWYTSNITFLSIVRMYVFTYVYVCMYVWMDGWMFLFICSRLNLKTVVDKLMKFIGLICTTNISKRAQGFFKILNFTFFMYFYNF